MSDLDELRAQMRTFTEERDWAKFHDPKSLILALVGEVGELAELFQWRPSASALNACTDPQMEKKVSAELADILLYLIRLADVLDIDLGDAAFQKLDSAKEKFPIDSFKGIAPEK